MTRKKPEDLSDLTEMRIVKNWNLPLHSKHDPYLAVHDISLVI